nr:NADH dehydrogenase subunit 6 [Ficopomatus enigmaticus]
MGFFSSFSLDMVVPALYFLLLGLSSPGELGSFTLGLCLFLSFLVGSMKFFWYGVLVWLTYISALLVLFLFFVSLTPKSEFSLASPQKVIFSAVFLVSVFIWTGFWEGCIFGGNSSSSMSMGHNFSFIWLGSLSCLCLSLAGLLLFCMVSVSKIVGRGFGSIRHYYY